MVLFRTAPQKRHPDFVELPSLSQQPVGHTGTAVSYRGGVPLQIGTFSALQVYAGDTASASIRWSRRTVARDEAGSAHSRSIPANNAGGLLRHPGSLGSLSRQKVPRELIRKAI